MRVFRDDCVNDHNAIIDEMVEARHFSSQLLAWAADPNQSNTIPNVPLLAGVLVELCKRVDEIEKGERVERAWH